MFCQVSAEDLICYLIFADVLKVSADVLKISSIFTLLANDRKRLQDISNPYMFVSPPTDPTFIFVYLFACLLSYDDTRQ